MRSEWIGNKREQTNCYCHDDFNFRIMEVIIEG